MKFFKHVTVCKHWIVTNHGVWFMDENEEAIESCSKTKTLAVDNFQKFYTRVDVEALEACQCTGGIDGVKLLYQPGVSEEVLESSDSHEILCVDKFLVFCLFVFTHFIDEKLKSVICHNIGHWMVLNIGYEQSEKRRI